MNNSRSGGTAQTHSFSDDVKFLEFFIGAFNDTEGTDYIINDVGVYFILLYISNYFYIKFYLINSNVYRSDHHYILCLKYFVN